MSFYGFSQIILFIYLWQMLKATLDKAVVLFAVGKKSKIFPIPTLAGALGEDYLKSIKNG